MEKPIQFYTPLENSATGNAILLMQKKVGNKLFVVPTMDTNISIFKANIFERSNKRMKQVAYISKVRYLFSPFTYYVFNQPNFCNWLKEIQIHVGYYK